MTKPKMTTEIDKRIGKKLKRLRRDKEISQSALGRASNVSFQQIQKYELGQTRITVGRLWSFCEVLQVSPTYFFEGLETVVTQSSSAANGGLEARSLNSTC